MHKPGSSGRAPLNRVGAVAQPGSEAGLCLERAIDGLEVPPFEGSVQVRYPLYTRAVERPPTLSLDADVAAAVDALEE